MANRNFANGGKIFMMHSKPVMVDVQITIGASGAVSSFGSSSPGASSMISSVTHGSAGQYVITLADSYQSLIGVINAAPQVASGVSGIDHLEQVGAMSLITSGQQPQSQIAVQTVLAGAAANPTSGAILRLIIMLNDSSAV